MRALNEGFKCCEVHLVSGRNFEKISCFPSSKVITPRVWQAESCFELAWFS